MGETYSGVKESRPNVFNDIAALSPKLEREFKGGCLAHAERTFATGLQCQAVNSMTALLSMEDAVLVVHSPQGCSGCAVRGGDNFRVGQIYRGVEHVRNPRIIVTNLDQKSVVFGGEKKLRDAIALAAERYDPKIIFVFTSCASAIIGDDVDTIVEEMQPNFKAVLVPIHCEGFKSKIASSGYDATFIAINKYILKGIKVQRQENLINLFAPVSVSQVDQIEIERILAQIGLEVNYIPFYGSLEKIKKIPMATASTAICKVFADEFMKTLEQEYGIPYSHTIMPLGVHNTDKWLRGIAKAAGKEKEAEEFIAREHERIQPVLDELRGRLEGKKVFVCGAGKGRAFAMAALAEDFGMKLVGLQTPFYDQDSQDDIEYLNELHGEYIVDVGRLQPFEQINLLKKIKPDLFIGYPIWAAKLGIPTCYINENKRPSMGYDSLLYIGNKIAEQLENPGFNKKLAEHRKLPFRESWYAENPLKFIKSN